MGIDVKSTRLARLGELRAERFSGSSAALAAAIKRSPSQVSQWFTGVRTITEESARHIEDALRLKRGWMDSAETSELATVDAGHFEDAGIPRTIRRVPIVGTAKLGDDGYYEELSYPTGHGDGWVESYSRDQNAYALRVKGDSMHPAIRHGQIVVVSPASQCVPGGFVLLALKDGRKMVKELVMERTGEITVESVNGGSRMTLERGDIEKMHAVSSIVFQHHWRPD